MKTKIYNLSRFFGKNKKTNTLSENLANSRTVFLILMMLFLKIDFLKAQTFPLSGATWIFKSNNPIWIDDFAQKWEYESDSITSEGIIKKMKVVSKEHNPAWYPFDTTVVSESYRYFLFVGDTIWDINDSLSPIANFSLQVGDSAFTPFHSSYSFIYPIITTSENCSHEDSLLFFQKGVVVENGIETENNISYRYYRLKFIDEIGDSVTRTFSERQIIASDYWHYELFNNCGAVVDGNPLNFVCYKDDFSESSTCNDIEWFESLNTIENRYLLNFEIYPNPASNILNIKTEMLRFDKLSLAIFNLKGKEMHRDELNNNGEIFQINISDFPNGFYFIESSDKNGTKHIQKFIKY